MEQKFVPLGVPTLIHRRSQPDVPEDIEEAYAHLNDPNWDLHSIETTSSPLSDQSFELEHKHKYASSINIGHSIGTGPSEFDTESRADSRTTESRLHLRSSDAFEYEE